MRQTTTLQWFAGLSETAQQQLLSWHAAADLQSKHWEYEVPILRIGDLLQYLSQYAGRRQVRKVFEDWADVGLPYGPDEDFDLIEELEELTEAVLDPEAYRRRVAAMEE
jgi:hypothetical protein